MDARERRRTILDALAGASDPVSGGALAREVGVSRQVVVGDIALLRADGQDVYKRQGRHSRQILRA